MPANG
jgi:hypothetical protein